MLTQSSEHTAIETDEELSHFYIEIASIVGAPENESDRAVYDLEVQGGVTPIGAVSRAATGVKIFDRPKMALTA